ncbi:4329_t:CDS:2, partial [Dentiscutata erythropus]
EFDSIEKIFKKVEGESNKALGTRFELFCTELLSRGRNVNEVEITVRVGNFDLGFLVVVDVSKIRPGAIEAAGSLKGKVIIIIYDRMSDVIKEAIFNLLRKEENRLIEENRFNLNYYLIYKY